VAKMASVEVQQPSVDRRGFTLGSLNWTAAPLRCGRHSLWVTLG
jgi:hypothetical protein